jgi:subtilisin family serine protease
LFVCLLTACGAPHADTKVEPELAQQMQADGLANAIVVLDMPESMPRMRDARARATWMQAVAAKQDEVLAAMGAPPTVRFRAVPAFAARIDAAALEALREHPGVVRVELDRGGAGQAADAVPFVHLDETRAAGFDGAGVKVALLDTGIDSTHPSLAGRVVDEACFCINACCALGAMQATGPGAALDDNGHGTHTAGILASNGAASPPGGTPAVDIVAVKVLDENNVFSSTSQVISGLDWVLTEHPDTRVVSASLATGTLYMGDCDEEGVGPMGLAMAADMLRDNGTLVVAASGNQGAAFVTATGAPACVASVLGVGAVWDADEGAAVTPHCTETETAPDRVACFTNASATTDMLAPGALIVSSWLGGGTSTRSGTSQAVPLVSACAAALVQADPSLTVDELEAALENSGVPVTDHRTGLVFPRLDCAAALALVQADGGPADAAVGADAGMDAGSDAATGNDAGPDASLDASQDALAPDDDAGGATPTGAGGSGGVGGSAEAGGAGGAASDASAPDADNPSMHDTGAPPTARDAASADAELERADGGDAGHDAAGSHPARAVPQPSCGCRLAPLPAAPATVWFWAAALTLVTARVRRRHSRTT